MSFEVNDKTIKIGSETSKRINFAAQAQEIEQTLKTPTNIKNMISSPLFMAICVGIYTMLIVSFVNPLFIQKKKLNRIEISHPCPKRVFILGISAFLACLLLPYAFQVKKM